MMGGAELAHLVRVFLPFDLENYVSCRRENAIICTLAPAMVQMYRVDGIYSQVLFRLSYLLSLAEIIPRRLRQKCAKGFITTLKRCLST